MMKNVTENFKLKKRIEIDLVWSKSAVWTMKGAGIGPKKDLITASVDIFWSLYI